MQNALTCGSAGAAKQSATAGGLNNGNLFSHNFRGWKSEIKVSTGLVPSEASLFGLQMAVFSVSSHGRLFVCLVLISSSYEVTSHTG